jgi:cbb3-type cytochrome oxidase maturation protein
VPLSFVVAIASGIAFWLAAEGGQFEDLDQPGESILGPDDLSD